MAENRLFKALVAIPSSVGNLLNGAVSSMSGPVGVTLPQPKLWLKHIRIINKTNAGVTITMYVGATGANAAGTEFALGANTVPANSYVDWYGDFEMDSTDFLTGVAGADTSLVANIEFEAGF